MSTRCQVEVKATGLPWKSESVVLYHHSDGYPTNMLPIIAAAYDNAVQPKDYGTFKYEKAWHAGRPGKSASYIVGADVDGFDIESGTDLHADIEWFYSVECVNSKGGIVGDKPTWRVSVYRTKEGFWDNSTRENLKLVATGTPAALSKRAKRLEDKE